MDVKILEPVVGARFVPNLYFHVDVFRFFSLPKVLDLDLLLNLAMVSWHVSGLGNDCYRCRRKGRSFCHK